MRVLDEMLEAFGLPPAERGAGLFARSEGTVDGLALTVEVRARLDLLIAVAIPHPTDLGLCLVQGARAALTRLATWGLRFSLDDRGIEGEARVPSSGEAVSSRFWMLDGLRDPLRPRPARRHIAERCGQRHRGAAGPP